MWLKQQTWLIHSISLKEDIINCINWALFYKSVPLTLDNVTVNQQYQDPKTEAAEWNPAFVILAIYTCSITSSVIKVCSTV